MMKKLLLLSFCFFSLVQAGQEENFKIIPHDPSKIFAFTPKSLEKFETQDTQYPYGIRAKEFIPNEEANQSTLLYIFRNEADADKILSAHLIANHANWDCLYPFNDNIIKKIFSGYYEKAQ